MKQKNCILLNIEMTKHLYKASPGYFFINLFNSIYNSFAFIIQSLFYKHIIDLVVYSKVEIKECMILFLLYYLCSVLTSYINFKVRSQYNEKAKIKIGLYYKKLIYSESAKKAIKNFDLIEYANKLHNAAYSDGNYLYAFSERIFGLIDGIIILIFFFGLFLKTHPFFICVAFLIAIKNMICVNKKNKIIYQQHETDLLFNRTDKYIYNMFFLQKYVHEIRMFPIGDFFLEKYKILKKQWWKNKKGNEYKEEVIIAISEGLDVLFQIINICILSGLLVNKLITVGEFSLILANTKAVAGIMERIFMFYSGICDDARYMREVFDIIYSKDHAFPEVEINDNKAIVTFQNVFFSYTEGQIVLNDIDLDFPLDKKIAIVGENGSGKSTFIKLLLGLYVPDSGKITYCHNNRNITDSSQLFSMMLQDFRTFPLSIRENISANSNLEETSLKQIEDALEFSELREKVESFPRGVDTVLTSEFCDDGVYLSGGELQKLAIARTYIKETPVLVLDEPSSNLDPIAESRVINKINAISENKAVVLITHNLLYTKNVDLVYVFKHGRIVEYGSPETLIEQKGYYYKMLEEQIKMTRNINDV